MFRLTVYEMILLVCFLCRGKLVLPKEAKLKLQEKYPCLKVISGSQLKMDLALCYSQYEVEMEKKKRPKDKEEDEASGSKGNMEVSEGLDDYLNEQFAQFSRFMKDFDCPPYEEEETTPVVAEGDVVVEKVVQVDPVDKYSYLL